MSERSSSNRDNTPRHRPQSEQNRATDWDTPDVLMSRIAPAAASGQSSRWFLISATALVAAILPLWLAPWDLLNWSITFLAFGSISLGFAVFVWDGGRRITPSGVYFLATALFVGIGSLYLKSVPLKAEPGTVISVLTAVHVTNIATLVCLRLFRRRRHNPLGTINHSRPTGGRQPLLIMTGLGLTVASLLISSIEALGPVASAGGRAGIFLVAAAAIPGQLKGTFGANRLVQAAAVIVAMAYIAVSYTGGGRLIVVGLGLGLIFIVNAARPSRLHKPVVLCAILPVLFLAGADRLDRSSFTEAGDGANVLIGGRGLASFYGPLNTFADIVERDSYPAGGRLGRQYGKTFVVSALVWVPRTVWTSKPPGFGAQITEVLNPSLQAVGHSDAALVYGEWYVNFWWFGLALLAVTVAYALARSDGWYRRCISRPRWRSHTVLSFAGLACIVSSLPDLVWVGTFTFSARGGLAAGLIGVMVVMSARRRRSVAGDRQAMSRSVIRQA